jgi:hypothetical protein
MRTFLISYDLANASARHMLASEIMQLGEAWARPLDNTWYVRIKARATEVEGRMRGLIGSDDGLLIQEVEADAFLLNTALRWFKKRRPEGGDFPTNIVAFPAPAHAGREAAAEAA